MQKIFGFPDTTETLSDMLTHTLRRIEGEHTTLRELIEIMGEQGLLLLCVLLCLPFMIPVSIPGISIPFGGAIALIAVAIIFNRLPWLPKKILDREIHTEKLVPVLKKGVGIVAKIDRFVKPRLPALTTGILSNRVNGLVLLWAAIVMMLPLGIIPFSNTLPALAILLTATGMIQRDGLFILAGQAFAIAGTAYVGVILYGAVAAGQGVGGLLS
ncbi:exopolysaccharide biosynthesis protein [Asticcacaulis sp. BYS171W]|uniref:Exopolysaccharide biosynthesis protein n=1 Tax=Asticcacaulis aquaticus TaxID=2984212 RepID=A0ABT5HPB2_9CAUL|nr:exopolysaccharide biosynthesis protein [Asticcacaulis aquaticus]MDC7681904.1 exopolysaccharide biosynthesis protein [Asticcacaulis aquaticus]